MLVLSRKKEECLWIEHGGETLMIKITNVHGDKVRLGFDGPTSFNIVRDNVKKDEWHGHGPVQVQSVDDPEPLRSKRLPARPEQKSV